MEKSIPATDGDSKRSSKKFKPKGDKFDGPPPGPCWFCGETHWVQKCPTALAASKAQREKTGKKEYSRDADLAARAAKRAELENEKKTTLDLNEKELK